MNKDLTRSEKALRRLMAEGAVHRKAIIDAAIDCVKAFEKKDYQNLEKALDRKLEALDGEQRNTKRIQNLVMQKIELVL